MVQLVECPRDAMQGWAYPISTNKKVQYLNELLQVGFHTLDCGSFVSHKAIPQMADTSLLLPQLVRGSSATKLLVIIANVRGATEAAAFHQVDCLGFPFSVSPTFQLRNTNSSIEESFERLETIQNICIQNNKEAVVYISMGFGNPYGDAYNEDTVYKWVSRIVDLGIRTISLADTVGVATPEQVFDITSYTITTFPEVNVGVHLHSAPHNRTTKLQAALDARCNRFDSAINGIGGCPMANDHLVGNMDTLEMLSFFKIRQLPVAIDEKQLAHCIALADSIFTFHD